MLHSTLVPRCNDSSPRSKKEPILAITLRFRSPGVIIVTVMRRGRSPRTRTPSIASAKRLVAALKNLSVNNWAIISPDLYGWTAYIDKDRSISPPQPKPPTGPTEAISSEHINLLDRRIPVLGVIGADRKITWNGGAK